MTLYLPIADRRTQALEFIAAYTAEHGYPPSRRDIAEHFGYASSQGGQFIIDDLVREGLITVTPKVPRSIRVITGANMVAPEVTG